MQKRLFTLLIATILWQPAGAVDIELGEDVIGTLDTLRIEQSPDDPTRISATLTATFPTFVQNIDQQMFSLGNLNTCGNRLYWAGNTSIRDTGGSLGLQSNIRYENWICVTILGERLTTRTVRATESIGWRVSVNPAPIDQLAITASVEDVSNLPPLLEQLLGLRVTETIDIPLPADCGRCGCQDLVEELEPVAESTTFSREGDTGIRITMAFSMSSDIDLQRCD